MSELVPNLRHGVVVGKHLAIRRAFTELMRVISYVAIAAHGCPIRWPFLHLVRADINRLHEPPLKAAIRAAALEIVLGFTNAGHIPASRPVARRARFLVVDAKIA